MRQQLSQLRQPFPDGSVWVRTEPIGHLGADYRTAPHEHAWHQLTFAWSGHLEVETEGAQALVPRDRAVWVPAGLTHRETMRAPVVVRTLYLAPGAMPSEPPSRTRTLAVSPLLRELIAHVSPLGALDHDRPRHAHLVDLIVDLIADAPEVSLRLPTPRDARARRLAELIRGAPGDRATVSELSRRAGASRRTLERCFLRETGLGVAEWRRRVRLLSSVRLLERGAPVSEVADAVGYRTASAFGAAYARYFGESPTVARKRRRSGRRR